jgi:2-polyprenyl-3-methyl-5-hydroxy-6-metoxy-1,4-benzoquinol methylase
MLEVTGERLLPDQQRGELVHAEHLARYRFAAQFAPGCRTLDVACGEGYGTAMLAAAGASEVVGVDIDEASVAHAAQKYGLRFERADASSLPFEDDSFDLIVSFETIEHVQNPEAMLAQFRRVLRPGGLLVISTPNSGEYLMESGYHTRDFSSQEFRSLLGQHFAEVKILYQQNWLLSAVLGRDQFALEDESRPMELDVVKVAGAEPGRELYAIALCGREVESVGETGVATGIFEAHALANRVEETERHLNAWVERAREAERLLKAWKERAEEAERQVEETRATLERLESSLSWRITKPLRWLKALARR